MPERVHLLVWPTRADTTVDNISWFLVGRQTTRLAASQGTIGNHGRAGCWSDSPLALVLGTWAFRFWQKGPGCERNLQSADTVTAAIDYIHLNPVRRKLVGSATQWSWSSGAWYVCEGRNVDPDLPTIRSPRAGLLGA